MTLDHRDASDRMQAWVAAHDRPAPGRLEFMRAFVNTIDRDHRTETLTHPEHVRKWLIDHDFASPDLIVTKTGLRHTIDVREAFRSLLLANTGSPVPLAATTTVNDVAERAGLAPRLAADGTKRLTIAASGLDAALGALAVVMFDAIAAGTWKRLRVCVNRTCQWAYYDTSRNHTSRWCDMNICGNRAKQHALSQRRKAIRQEAASDRAAGQRGG